MSTAPFLTRVELRNYKSIKTCAVDLAALTFLVGPNGAGKSNFLDALRFVAEALQSSPAAALRRRGGVRMVARRARRPSNHFAIRVHFALPGGVRGRYAFRIEVRDAGAYVIRSEECVVTTGGPAPARRFYRVESGEVSASFEVRPPYAGDRLYLVPVSGFPEFRPVYDFLSTMQFYAPSPERIAGDSRPDPTVLLTPDGGNTGSLLLRLDQTGSEAKQRIDDYLRLIVPGLRETKVAETADGRIEVKFLQETRGARTPVSFDAASMSAGTLHALAVLLAAFQFHNGGNAGARLIGVEEPEIALHPGAAGILLAALRDASRTTQIVATSHSADLLDDAELDADSIRAVALQDGESIIGPPDWTSRSVLRDRLYTAGELLRMNQLIPETASRTVNAPEALSNGGGGR